VVDVAQNLPELRDHQVIAFTGLENIARKTIEKEPFHIVAFIQW
jgi:hypothetical protein